MAAAQAHALAPQLETCLRHPLPLTTNRMVGGSKGIVARVASRGHSFWYYNTKKTHVKYFNIICRSCKGEFLLTCISSSDNLVQNLMLERPLQGLHKHLITGPRSEPYQGSSGGSAWQADLDRRSFSCKYTR